MTKEFIRRKLGYENHQQLLLRRENIDSIVVYSVVRESSGNWKCIQSYLGIRSDSVMGWLQRYVLVFFIITNSFVGVFLMNTKMDSYKRGQWVIFVSIGPIYFVLLVITKINTTNGGSFPSGGQRQYVKYVNHVPNNRRVVCGRILFNDHL